MNAKHSPPFGVVIPARYGARRLPGKPLRMLRGEPLIVQVYRRAACAGAQFVIVATDDERIAQAVRGVGGQAVMTSAEHTNGTERVAEAVRSAGYPPQTVIINIQGDELFVDPSAIGALAAAQGRRPDGMATLATPIQDAEDLANPSIVKVVTDAAGRALYFSRAAIPARPPGVAEPALPGPYLRHIGVYAYSVRVLEQLTAHPPVAIERVESLEQLRALYLGVPIAVHVVASAPHLSVDTEEDLVRVQHLLAEQAAC